MCEVYDSLLGAKIEDEKETKDVFRKPKCRILDLCLKKVENFKKEISLKMIFLLVSLVILGTSNRVSFKVMTNSLMMTVSEDGELVSYYSTFIAQITNFIYLPVFWPIVWYSIKISKTITPEMRAFPLWKYAVMGGLDAIAGVLMICGGSQTSGPLQQLLVQGSIPFSILFSVLLVNRFVVRIIGKTLDCQYRWTHYFSSFLIVTGIMVAFVPKIISDNGGTVPSFAIMFFFACIPVAISTIFKEIAFKDSDLDINLVNAWVVTFQFIIGFPALLITASVQDNPGEYIKQLPWDFWHGMQCFLGINTFEKYGFTTNLCKDRLVWLHICTYMFINIFYNVIILAVIKHGSATLLQISSALTLPFSNICFTFGFIMNEFPKLPLNSLPCEIQREILKIPPPAQPPTPSSWVSNPPTHNNDPKTNSIEFRAATSRSGKLHSGSDDPSKSIHCVPSSGKPINRKAFENIQSFNIYSDKLSKFDIGGLVIILIGLIVYRIYPENTTEDKEHRYSAIASDETAGMKDESIHKALNDSEN